MVVTGPREAHPARDRRRWLVAGTGSLAAGLLANALAAEPGSRRFFVGTVSVAALYTAGALGSGPVPLGTPGVRARLVVPVTAGVGAFGVFYLGALVVRRVPFLRRAIAGVLRHAGNGDTAAVLFTTVLNGAAEEVFYRGAVYDAVGGARPVAASTAAYGLATSVSGNPALVFASLLMGTLFAVQRRHTGGIAAATTTHLTWSVLMYRFLPPLFTDRPEQVADTRSGVLPRPDR